MVKFLGEAFHKLDLSEDGVVDVDEFAEVGTLLFDHDPVLKKPEGLKKSKSSSERNSKKNSKKNKKKHSSKPIASEKIKLRSSKSKKKSLRKSSVSTSLLFLCFPSFHILLTFACSILFNYIERHNLEHTLFVKILVIPKILLNKRLFYAYFFLFNTDRKVTKQ